MNWSWLLTELGKLGLNPSQLIILLLGITIFIWLFREFSKIITNDNTSALQRIEKRLDVYGSLEVALLYYVRTETEASEKQLQEMIGKSYTYLSPDLFEKLASFRNLPDQNIIWDCLQLLRLEIKELRTQYDKKLPFVEQKVFAGDTEYYVKIGVRLLTPVIFAGFTLIIIYFGILWIFHALTQSTLEEGVRVLFKGIAFIVWLMGLFYIINVFIKKLFLFRFKSIVLLTIYFVLPFVLWFLTNTFLTVISWILIFVYIVFLLWNIMKGKKSN